MDFAWSEEQVSTGRTVETAAAKCQCVRVAATSAASISGVLAPTPSKDRSPVGR
jgi:hypothetical protein